eukprot:gene3567-2518_t
MFACLYFILVKLITGKPGLWLVYVVSGVYFECVAGMIVLMVEVGCLVTACLWNVLSIGMFTMNFVCLQIVNNAGVDLFVVECFRNCFSVLELTLVCVGGAVYVWFANFVKRLCSFLMLVCKDLFRSFIHILLNGVLRCYCVLGFVVSPVLRFDCLLLIATIVVVGWAAKILRYVLAMQWHVLTTYSLSVTCFIILWLFLLQICFNCGDLMLEEVCSCGLWLRLLSVIISFNIYTHSYCFRRFVTVYALSLVLYLDLVVCILQVLFIAALPMLEVVISGAEVFYCILHDLVISICAMASRAWRVDLCDVLCFAVWGGYKFVLRVARLSTGGTVMVIWLVAFQAVAYLLKCGIACTNVLVSTCSFVWAIYRMLQIYDLYIHLFCITRCTTGEPNVVILGCDNLDTIVFMPRCLGCDLMVVVCLQVGCCLRVGMYMDAMSMRWWFRVLFNVSNVTVAWLLMSFIWFAVWLDKLLCESRMRRLGCGFDVVRYNALQVVRVLRCIWVFLAEVVYDTCNVGFRLELVVFGCMDLHSHTLLGWFAVVSSLVWFECCGLDKFVIYVAACMGGLLLGRVVFKVPTNCQWEHDSLFGLWVPMIVDTAVGGVLFYFWFNYFAWFAIYFNYFSFLLTLICRYGLLLTVLFVMR